MMRMRINLLYDLVTGLKGIIGSQRRRLEECFSEAASATGSELEP